MLPLNFEPPIRLDPKKPLFPQVWEQWKRHLINTWRLAVWMFTNKVLWLLILLIFAIAATMDLINFLRR